MEPVARVVPANEAIPYPHIERLCDVSGIVGASLYPSPIDPAAAKHRASYLTVAQQYNLNVACKPLTAFGYGTYHVGSSLKRPDYRDVDLRCILEDSEFDRMFDIEHGDGSGREFVEARLLFLNTAISEWLAARTGLPIDFQFQKATEANETIVSPRRGD